jgi:mycothiol synthase
VRAFNLDEDLEAAVRVFRETFNDHWGHIDIPFEEQVAQWGHRYRSDPDFDGTLSSLVVANGELIGLALCDLRHPEDPAMGMIGVLGVRREWRRQGIARALLHRSFREMKAHGQKSVCLGVDADSLTGAVRVYEAAGMKPARQTDVFEKELRAGTDLSLQTLDSEECS